MAPPGKPGRRAARERISAYYETELAILIAYVEKAIARYRAGEADVHDVDEVMHQYSKAARSLWVFCWSGGGGSNVELVAGILDRSGDEARRGWWEEAAFKRRRGPGSQE